MRLMWWRFFFWSASKTRFEIIFCSTCFASPIPQTVCLSNWTFGFHCVNFAKCFLCTRNGKYGEAERWKMMIPKAKHITKKCAISDRPRSRWRKQEWRVTMSFTITIISTQAQHLLMRFSCDVCHQTMKTNDIHTCSHPFQPMPGCCVW